MARRRQHTQEDSLELLLDTICNVFGGIILMAILVVLQTQVSAGRLPNQDPAAVIRNRERNNLRNAASRISQQIADLETESRRLADLIRKNPASPEMQRLVKAAQDLRNRIRHAHDQADVAKNQAAADFQEIAAIQANIEKTKQDLDQIKGEGNIPNLKHVHLPIQKGRGQGKAAWYVIRGDRAYRLPQAIEPSGAPKQQGDCSVAIGQAGGMPVAHVTPINGEGLPAPTQDPRKGPFAQALRDSNPAPGYVVLFVYDDSESFAAFQQFKAAVVAAKLAYVIRPKAKPGSSLMLHFGQGPAPDLDG